MIAFLLCLTLFLAFVVILLIPFVVLLIRDHNRLAVSIRLLSEQLNALDERAWPVVEAYHERLKALKQYGKQ